MKDTTIALSPEQQDVLNELINIGFGRAASSLSMLVNQRVLLNVPQLRICALNQVGDSLLELAQSELVHVHQIFRGKLSGSVMLLMDVHSANILIDLLNGGDGQSGPITANNQEALAEVGNVVVSAFLGAFGNLLKIHLAFTVPFLKFETLVQLTQSLLENELQGSYAIVVKIRFQLAEKDVTGYLVVLMDAPQLEILLTSLHENAML